ncbi:expressed protein, partial [Phakopsora pachyrhizi]
MNRVLKIKFEDFQNLIRNIGINIVLAVFLMSCRVQNMSQQIVKWDTLYSKYTLLNKPSFMSILMFLKNFLHHLLLLH